MTTARLQETTTEGLGIAVSRLLGKGGFELVGPALVDGAETVAVDMFLQGAN